ncbi:hypothetical protein E3P81_00422 [Wallemia ichthyophaga]|nr:hypothetical protein E3P97_00424 [Wallemia ichthyophaga]TIB35555.1 hypothetical protein E3P85_00424 [Wallemia ichthyophaga]TIB50690.1 hypothetical protein E3P82_00424 [Wallemia ichthyophaga]TIB54159.1 hypothetical protein E3P81_00422 [Wallemia ichthyophaga]TIB56709.1 hypothetical protein E3P80_00424 [Wallemia ichthyophaga]
MDCSICFDSLSSGTTAAVKCACRYAVHTQHDLIKLHLGDSDESRDVKVEKLLDISRKIHSLTLKRDQGSLRVIFEDILQIVSGCDINDENTAKLLRILSKELRGLNERLDQSRTVAELNDKIASLSDLLATFDAHKKKEIGKLKLDHTKQLARISAEEVHLRHSYEKSLADNAKVKKDHSLHITMKDDRLAQMERNESRLRGLLSDSETAQNRFKSNITEWKRKYDKLQKKKDERGNGGEKGGSDSASNNVTPSTCTSKAIHIDSSDAEVESPIAQNKLKRTNKRKSDDVLILPPDDDVDLALDEPLPSFAVKKRATGAGVTQGPVSGPKKGPKVLSISRNTLKQPTHSAIPSNSLLALGPKMHKKIPTHPPYKR